MRLLFVTEFFPGNKRIFTGGVEARTFFTIQELKKHHQVKVISRSSSKVPATFLSIFSRLWFIISSTVKGLRLPRLDLVEGSNVVCYLPAWIIARAKGAKAVAWIPDVLGSNWRYFGFTGDECNDAQITGPAKKLHRRGINPDKITVVYPGVDIGEFQGQARRRNSPTVCVISRLVPYKKVGDSLKLLSQLKTQLPQVKLLVIGEGPELKSLRQQSKPLKQVYFKSRLPRSELIKELKSCHLLCHFSTVEGFGLVILEALAAGLPYIAYDTPINREVTRHGQGGLLLPLKQPFDTAAVLKLLTDPEVRQQKLDQGSKLLQTYSWKKSAKMVESAYGL